MKEEDKEIKESEKPERGQCELDDNALEQAAGGILKLKDSPELWICARS